MLELGIICYKQRETSDNTVTFTLEELNKLVSSINIVSDIKNIIQSKTKTNTDYLTINSNYSSKHSNLDLVKHYTDKVYVNNLIGHQEISEHVEQNLNINLNINNKDNQETYLEEDLEEDLEQTEIVEIIEEYVDDDGSGEYMDGEEIIEIIEEIYEDSVDNS